MNKYRNSPLGISELEMQIILLHKCFWLESLCQILAWRQNMEELHFQSSKIQIEEQFGCVWIYHAISSSHMQTNTAAVPWASQQHGFVDGTQPVAMISSHSLLANLFNGLSLESCAWPQMLSPAMCEKLWSAAGGSQPEHWWETCSVWPLLPSIWEPVFQKAKSAHFLEISQHWNVSNWATKRTANFVGFVGLAFFSSWEILTEERGITKAGSYSAHMSSVF